MSNVRQLRLGAFMRPASIHTAAWRYPGGLPDANFNFKIRFIMGIFLCILVGIVVWWLVLFSRSSVAGQFLGAKLHAERPAGIHDDAQMNPLLSGRAAIPKRFEECEISELR